jgi:hypothetical protein
MADLKGWIKQRSKTNGKVLFLSSWAEPLLATHAKRLK